MYCEFADNENFIEYYNLANDPWELDNVFDTLSPTKKSELAQKLEAYRQCDGATCRSL